MATKNQTLPRPTDSELRILKVLWQHNNEGPLSVREVLGHLDSQVGYTTVLKLLQIMLSKGLVERDERERSHRYAAARPRTAVEGGLVSDLLHRLFDGSATQLVQTAIDNEDLDSEELADIERLIRNARRRARRNSGEQGTVTKSTPTRSTAKVARDSRRGVKS